MEIKRATSLQAGPGSSEWFTGSVQVTALFQAPARVASARVRFAPGARTHWHTHPLGQTLLVTEGQGWAQRKGGPVEQLSPGDVVWFPPGEKHWHGAQPHAAMTHIALQEQLDGSTVSWLEPVSEAEYQQEAEPPEHPERP